VGKLNQQRERLVWGNRTVLVVHRERQQRGTTELASAPLPTFNFENCWPVMLAVADGL
jgi:hypothetical protein